MLKRILGYLNSMYPPLPRLLFALTYFFAFYFAQGASIGKSHLEVTPVSVAGAITVFLFLMFLRVSDELKDLEIDMRLFPDRVVPSGGVTVPDLKVLLGVTVTLMFVINMFFGNALVPFLILFGFGFLMLKFFFYPEVISKDLLLALVTHNPSVLFLNYYIMCVFANEQNADISYKDAMILNVIFWLPGLIWELCRKIRAPQDENEYMTYSRVFGTKLAAIIPAALMTFHLGIVQYLGMAMNFTIFFKAGFSVLYIICLIPYVRFLMKPSTTTAKLKPFGELYMFGAFSAILIEMILTRGVQWIGN